MSFRPAPHDSEKKTGDSLYDEPLQRLLQAMDDGVCPWHNPCLAMDISNAKSGKAYRGFNQLYLSMITTVHGYRSPYWMSFKQTNDFGGHVKKGAKSTIVVYRKLLDPNEKKTDAEKTSAVGAPWQPTIQAPKPETPPRPGGPLQPQLKRKYSKTFYHRVFAFDQTEGADIGMNPYPTVQRVPTPVEAEERAKLIIANFADCPPITHNESITEERAGGYNVTKDKILMRPPEDYPTAGSYYNVLFHELSHGCCSEKRLGFHKKDQFGGKEYAFEELTVEIAANLLLVKAGLENEELRKNSGAYLRHWKARIAEDPKMLISASQRATRIVNLVLGVTPDAEVNKVPPKIEVPGLAAETEVEGEDLDPEPSIG